MSNRLNCSDFSHLPGPSCEKFGLARIARQAGHNEQKYSYGQWVINILKRQVKISRLVGVFLVSFSWHLLAFEASEMITGTPPILVQHCFACHGPNGQSNSPAIPSIAGLPKRYLVEVLQAYQYGGRFGTVMDRLIQGYREAEIELIADYFSHQPYPMAKQNVQRNLVSLGRKLHRRYCLDCHGDITCQPQEGVPLLNGRWIDYLRWTVHDYLVGINQGDEEMSKQLARLLRFHGSEGLEALLHYYGYAKP
jgi:sulfide dehydrogenase cytochrome subunit